MWIQNLHLNVLVIHLSSQQRRYGQLNRKKQKTQRRYDNKMKTSKPNAITFQVNLVHLTSDTCTRGAKTKK